MKAYWESKGIAPRVLDHGTRWRFTTTSSQKVLTRLGLWAFAREFNNPVHELICILLLDHKLTLPKYGTNNTIFLGMEACTVGK
jgi:hypothetical protein